jgi:transposase
MAQRIKHRHLGADVDSRFIQIHEHESGSTEKIENTASGITRWLRSQAAPARLAAESTGSYHMELVDQAHAAGMTVYVLNPRHVKSYREGVGQRAKTDPCDARLIARYLQRERDQLRPYRPQSKAQRKAWQLLKRRVTLVRAKDQIQQSFRELSGLDGCLDTVLKDLNRLIALLEKRLEALLKQQGHWNKVLNCRSIPGVGRITSMSLVVAYLRGEFRSADSFVAYLGLDVRVRESGRFSGRRKLTKQGDAECRRILYNAAMTGRRYAFADYYERLTARGLKPTQAFVAVARKQVRIAFSLMQNGVDFDPDRLKAA